MTTTLDPQLLVPPQAPGQWTLRQIQEALKRPLPAAALETRKQGGTNLTYVPWHVANRILDKYAPGWTWEIRTLYTTGDRIFLVGRLTIPTAEGNIYREATGTETLKEDKAVVVDKKTFPDEFGRPITEAKELAYGDPSSNAESMAFRRAAARFGLALYLYDKG